jgi:hypothetical protein
MWKRWIAVLVMLAILALGLQIVLAEALPS